MNEPSPPKWHWPIIVWVMLTVAALVTGLLIAGYLYLPTLVTDRLPVTQIQRLGFADFTGRVSRIGPHQTVAGPFFFGPTEQPALSIHSIELDYTLGELRQKKIRRIRIGDVAVNGIIDENGLAFPGLNSSRLAKQAPVDQARSEPPSPLADMTVDKLEIRSGLVNLTWRNATYKIPFEADLEPDGRDMTRLAVHVRLFPRDQPMALTAQLDLKNQKARVSLDGSLIALDGFADLIHLIPGLDATGRVTVQAKAMLKWTPFTITDVNVDLTWPSGRLAWASAVIEPGSDEAPAVLSAVSNNLKTWQIRAGGLQLRTPASVAMNMLAATVSLAGDMRVVAGKTELTIPPFSLGRPTPASLKTTVRLPLTFNFRHDPTDAWSAAMETLDLNQGRPSLPLEMMLSGVNIQADRPRFSLTATGDGEGGTAHWQLDLHKIQATTAGAVVNLPSVDAKGQLQLKGASPKPVWVGEARVHLPKAIFDGGGMAGKIDDLTLSASFNQPGGNAPVVDARMRFANGQFNHDGSGLRLSGGRLDLPYCSAPKTTGREGTFSVARLVHNERFLGNLQGRVTQKKNAYAFDATHVSDLFPGMTAAITGTFPAAVSRFPAADLTFTILPYELPAESHLGRFIPAAQGVTLSGTVSAQGKGTLSSTGIRGNVDVAMQGGVLRLAEKKIALEGIDTALRFPELPRIRSAPGQQFRFARAAMGGIVVDGGAFDFQVESETTLFIEKGRLLWCGGKVDAQSLRINPSRQDYHVSLYCQRLGLSRILEQLGSVNARGTGTVNGRIPIVYSKGNIGFDDGFLFSTPGETGRIQITGTEILTRGIPTGTPQFAQVELAREALKDYAYTWAKLGLVSEKEDLIMRLQFDGKPVNPLPFIYKKEIGSFVRVESGAQGSVFQGISLDVNLRLPLNQLLQYKDIINMIE